MSHPPAWNKEHGGTPVPPVKGASSPLHSPINFNHSYKA